MTTMNVSLPSPMKSWVEAQVQTGHYSNASDYVRDLIRQDQEYQSKRKALIASVEAGDKSGKSNRSIDDIWQDVQARHDFDV